MLSAAGNGVGATVKYSTLGSEEGSLNMSMQGSITAQFSPRPAHVPESNTRRCEATWFALSLNCKEPHHACVSGGAQSLPAAWNRTLWCPDTTKDSPQAAASWNRIHALLQMGGGIFPAGSVLMSRLRSCSS